MASSNGDGLASAVAATLLILAAAAVPAAAQSNQPVTICQATGSQASPWVFTTIEAADLPEHLARGDFQASSIADCPGAQSAGTPTPPPSSVRQQQGVGGGATSASTPAAPSTASNASVFQAGQAATATPRPTQTLPPIPTPTRVVANATAEPEVSVAGAQATPEPQVSTLPKSGGEPDRRLLTVVLLGLVGVGLGLRRLSRPAPDR